MRMKNGIIKIIYEELESIADTKVREGAERYFKGETLFHGVKLPIVRQLSRKYYPQVKKLAKAEIFSICTELLETRYQEEATIAIDWAYRLRAKYEPEDFKTFEEWVDSYVDNWAKCDDLCNHVLWAFMGKYPSFTANLKEWAKANNMWRRRAAAVTLVKPASQGLFIDDVFEIADILLIDNEDLVQKGYGWMLKAASESQRQKVFDYVMKNKQVMPRTALRYAIEKMPDNLKKEAMKKT